MWMVTVAPAGIAGLIMENVRLAEYGQLFKLLPSYVLLLLTGGGCVLAFSALVEMTYFQQLELGSDSILHFMGLPLDTAAPACWLEALALLALTALAFGSVRRRFAKLWSTAEQAIKDEQAHARRVE